ncbi:MAG TPA: ABC transporter permease [Terriglobales bacterium]|nr:ABC transporter permease [Terriglobales bacterium]
MLVSISISLVRSLDKFTALLRRDLLTALRYRSGLVLAAAGGALELAGLYYLSRAIGPSFRPEGMDSYPFLLVGTGLYSFLLMGVSCVVSAIQEAQQAGTLEVLMTTPTGGSTLLLLSALSSLTARGLTFSMYLSMGLLLASSSFNSASLLACVIVVVLSFAVAAALGLGTAALQLLTHRGSAILWLLGSAVWMLVGAMFPVSALPRWVQFVSLAIPMTHAITAMRLALVSPGFSAALLRETAVLAAFAIVSLPIGFIMFEKALRHARLSGSLSYC